jgi:hypothetical protein
MARDCAWCAFVQIAILLAWANRNQYESRSERGRERDPTDRKQARRIRKQGRAIIAKVGEGATQQIARRPLCDTLTPYLHTMNTLALT